MTMPNEHASCPRVVLIVAGISALLAAIVFRRWLSAEFNLLQTMGMIQLDVPTEAASPLSWLAFLHTHRAVGLLLLNAFDLVNYALVAFAYFGIYSVLRQARRESMQIAMGLTVLGLFAYLVSNQAFNLVSLSDRYASTIDTNARTMILSAGQTELSLNDPTTFGTGLFWSYIALYLAGLIISLAMLQTRVFGKWTASFGIAANVFGLGYFFTSAFVPSLGIIPAVGSAPCNLAWYILSGLRLFRVAKEQG
jgi:hypothetical protein